MNGGGAFVDGQDFGVAVVLGSTGFLDESHAAVHLNAKRGHFQTHLGAVAFDKRHHELVKRQVLPANVCVRMVMRGVVSGSCHGCHAAAAFGVSAHGHQHAFDIGVVNDGRAGFDGAVNRSALHTVFGESHCFLVGPLRNRNALHTDCIPCGVHHDEHVLQPAVFLADQVTHSAAVITVLQYSGGRRLDSELVLNADAVNIVACTQRAVWIDQELGAHEQADALDTFRRTRDAGQHQMNDVFGHVMFAVGDVDFSSKHLVGAVVSGLGPAAHHRQIRTRLRFGQVHGARPLTTHQFFKEGRVEFVRARRQQRFNRPVTEQRTQRKAHVR